MNKVYLSGTVASALKLVQPENGAAHATFQLMVSHKTAKGQIRRELYPVNAWLKTALWAQATLQQGMPVSLQGYLTQKTIMEDGKPRTYVEVTADTFMLLAVSFKRSAEGTPDNPETANEPVEEAASWT